MYIAIGVVPLVHVFDVTFRFGGFLISIEVVQGGSVLTVRWSNCLYTMYGIILMSNK